MEYIALIVMATIAICLIDLTNRVMTHIFGPMPK